jgi:hypothetical protein
VRCLNNKSTLEPITLNALSSDLLLPNSGWLSIPRDGTAAEFHLHIRRWRKLRLIKLWLQRALSSPGSTQLQIGKEVYLLSANGIPIRRLVTAFSYQGHTGTLCLPSAITPYWTIWLACGMLRIVNKALATR